MVSRITRDWVTSTSAPIEYRLSIFLHKLGYFLKMLAASGVQTDRERSKNLDEFDSN